VILIKLFKMLPARFWAWRWKIADKCFRQNTEKVFILFCQSPGQIL